MFRFIRILLRAVSGWFGGLTNSWQSNKHVMADTYDRSIAKQEQRFGTVKEAVAELVAIEQTRVQEIKNLTKQIDEAEELMAGAKVGMQNRINTLRAQGKSKEEITADLEFQKFQTKFTKYQAEVNEKNEKLEEKEADLKARKEQIQKYKLELQDMQQRNQDLKEEKQEALADVAIAQQQDAINSVLAGIAQDSTDQDLVAVREARKKAKAKATVSAELSGNDARLADNELKELARGAAATQALDNVLDWGDEPETESLPPAKLSE